MKTNKNWVIIAVPHDQTGANELHAFLSKQGSVREIVMGDRFRGFYDAMGLDILRSAAWHNGFYVGGILDVKSYINYCADQQELDFG